MTDNLLGWQIEWSSAFRDNYIGVVVDETPKEIVAIEYDYDEEYRLPIDSKYVKKRPALDKYVAFKIRCWEKSGVNVSHASRTAKIIKEVSDINDNNSAMLIAKEMAITKFSKTVGRATSSSNGKFNVISLRNSVERNEITESSEEESDSEGEMSEEEDIVDLKVFIVKTKELRGFSVPVNKGFSTIMNILKENYGFQPLLSYCDDDGDKINMLAPSDFSYAVRAHKTTTSIERKSKKLGANKLRLTAEFPNVETDQDSNRTLKAGVGIRIVSSSSSDTRDMKSNTSSVPQLSIDTKSDLTFICVNTDPSQNEINKLKSSELLWQRGELIGTGSFGQVYSGIDVSTGIRIAVKEVMMGKGKKHELQAMALLQEIRILSKLDHPNIIKYLGTEYSHHTMRIFLELATEGSLKDALIDFGALAEPIIRRYTLDIVTGLAFLHSKRFIHRDIKPTNLLISNGIIKVADFGCSSSSFDPVGGGETSEMGHATVAGTTVYMAPEVMGIEDEVNNKNDNKEPCVNRAKINEKKPDLHSDMLFLTSIPVTARGRSDDSNDIYDRDKKEDAIKSIKSSSEVSTARMDCVHKCKNDEDLSEAEIKRMLRDDSPVKMKSPLRDKRNGYGRKADIWSLGITLCEMSTGKAPYRTAAAAIYNICVSKRYPSFSESSMSPDAHHFLGRCLVADPLLRASCEDLLAHPFLLPQESATLPMKNGIHTISTLSFSPHSSLPVKLNRSSSSNIESTFTDPKVKKAGNSSRKWDESDGEEERLDSKYSSVGVTNSWLKAPRTKSVGRGRGRREGGEREHSDAIRFERSTYNNSVDGTEGGFTGLLSDEESMFKSPRSRDQRK